METIVEEKVRTDSAELQNARQRLSEAEARRKTQADVVARARQDLASKQDLAARLRTRYDECCLGQDQAGAMECQNELDLLRAQERGCELRLKAAGQQLQKCDSNLSGARSEVSQLLREQQLAEERMQTAKLIEATEQSYLTQHEALQRFNNLMEELKSRPFMDAENKRRATDAHFRLQSLFNGYGWHKPPEPKTQSS
jgi:chromosome segregation ATPase